jgi:single-strand DNA-binding protein
MAGETSITFIGNLTADPELKFTPSGAAVANFTVASTPRTFDRQTNEWKDGDALFIRCAAWRQLAENAAETLQKGQRVIVTGNLRVKNFDRQDGSKGTSVDIDVEEVGPSLRFATAKVTRVQRGQGGQQQPQGQPHAQQPQGQGGWGGQPTHQQPSTAWSGQQSYEEPPF